MLAQLQTAFHQAPEFDLYLRALPHTYKATVQAFLRLTRACAETPRLDWVRHLRGYALHLNGACATTREAIASTMARAAAD